MKALLFVFIFFNLTIQPTLAQDKIRTIPVPSGFERVTVEDGSFAKWLRNLPLKPPETAVHDFSGQLFKSADDSTVARVLDIPVAGRRLEQCMDIIIRLHATYALESGKASLINYPLPGGLWLSWSEWRKGIFIDWRNGEWEKVNSGRAAKYAPDFEQYLRTIFNLSHTQQFYFQLPQVAVSDLQAGDFIIKKGSRGHAVLILDMCENDKGEKRVLIGQGDTPACGMYLLNNTKETPWFNIDANSDFPDLPIRKKMYWTGLRRFED